MLAMLSKYALLIYLQPAKFLFVAAIFIKHSPSWRGRAKTSIEHHSTGHLSTRLQLIQLRISQLCMIALSWATFLTLLTSFCPSICPTIISLILDALSQLQGGLGSTMDSYDPQKARA